MNIACCVSHDVENPGIWACLGSIAAIELDTIDNVRTIIGKPSATASLDSAISIARRSGADLLLHLRSDVLLTRNALNRLLAAYEANRPIMVLGRCYDPLIDDTMPGHVQLFDLGRLGNDFNFNQQGTECPETLGDFAELIYSEKGSSVVSSAGEEAIAYWKPVWTARDLYLHFSTEKDLFRLSRMRGLLERGLALNPNNAALQSAAAALQDSAGCDLITAEKDFERYSVTKDLDGTEYYVWQKFYAGLGKSILDSGVECICDKPQSNVPLIPWR